jgi:V/A-type H+/Na+-transporting ATPase subunit C
MADFDYGNARLHAMKSRLLTNRQIDELAGMGSLSGVVSGLMKTAYQPAIEYAIARTSGIETIYQALRQDILQTVRKIRSFYQQDAGEMVGWILRRYDVHNLKTILRGLGKQIAPSEILSTLLPVGDLDEIILVELTRASTPRFAVDYLASMNLPIAHPLLKLRTEYPGVDTVEMESVLERWYYQEFYQILENLRQDRTVLGEAFALEADITNLQTILRFIHTPAERKILRDQFLVESQGKPGVTNQSPEDEPIRDLLVGPGNLPFNLLVTLSNQDDMSNAINLLSSTAYAPYLDAGYQDYRQSSRLSDIERQLNRYRLHWMVHQIPNDPLGIGVVFGYLALKMNEISNLRWIAQGVQAGFTAEAIRSGMEFA